MGKALRAIFAACVALFALTCAASAQPWKVFKDHWSQEDEEGYSRFVQAIGESGCSTPDDCFESHANPYASSDPPGIRLHADCADLPYLLRAYYAWKNGLPFSWATAVAPRGRGGGDIRFNTTGNRVVGRSSVIGRSGGTNGPSILYAIRDQISSASYRVAHTFDKGGDVSDFYSPKIARGSIRPGTVIYDINGHVTLVYKVTEDGRIHYMDSHPDNSLTRSMFGGQFARDDPALGSGFKNFRPFQLVGAHQAGDGSLVGGRIVFAENEQIPDFSAEQYYGNVPGFDSDWKTGKFRNGKSEMNFYDYVRFKLADPNFAFNPVNELRESMRSICGDLRDRLMSVYLAQLAGVHRKDHPGRLPDNIYGTNSMEWEVYSTPSRDARLKTRFVELRNNMARLIKAFENRDPNVRYTGANLKADLLAAFQEQSQKCGVNYRNSDGKVLALSFEEVMKRLYRLSFDPYHCVELRWGASLKEELASCDDSPLKLRWYEAEQRLRNQIDRTYGTPMGFTLDDLRAGKRGSGRDDAPDVDVLAVIKGMSGTVVAEGDDEDEKPRRRGRNRDSR